MFVFADEMQYVRRVEKRILLNSEMRYKISLTVRGARCITRSVASDDMKGENVGKVQLLICTTIITSTGLIL